MEKPWMKASNQYETEEKQTKDTNKTSSAKNNSNSDDNSPDSSLIAEDKNNPRYSFWKLHIFDKENHITVHKSSKAINAKSSIFDIDNNKLDKVKDLIIKSKTNSFIDNLTTKTEITWKTFQSKIEKDVENVWWGIYKSKYSNYVKGNFYPVAMLPQVELFASEIKYYTKKLHLHFSVFILRIFVKQWPTLYNYINKELNIFGITIAELVKIKHCWINSSSDIEYAFDSSVWAMLNLNMNNLWVELFNKEIIIKNPKCNELINESSNISITQDIVDTVIFLTQVEEFGEYQKLIEYLNGFDTTGNGEDNDEEEDLEEIEEINPDFWDFEEDNIDCEDEEIDIMDTDIRSSDKEETKESEKDNNLAQWKISKEIWKKTI